MINRFITATLMLFAFLGTVLILQMIKANLGLSRPVWIGVELIFVLAVSVSLTRLSRYSMLNMAAAAHKKQDFAKSLKLSLDGIAKYPKEVNFYVMASAAYGGMRQWNEALEMASKAIALNGNSPTAWNNRAYVHMHMGEFNAAEHDAYHAGECAKKMLAVASRMVVFQTRAAVYIWNCRYDEALADADYLEKKGQRSRGLYIRAVVMGCINQHEDAIDYCDLAFAGTKDETLRAHILAARAVACDSLGRREEAIADANAAVKEAPTHYSHRIGRAHLHSRAGDYTEAADDLGVVEQVELSNMERALFLSSKARLQLLTGAEAEQACRLAGEALRLRPELPVLLCTHAWALKSAGNYTAARANLSKAIEIDKHHAEAYWLRSEVYAALGDAKSAQADKAMADKLRYRPYAQVRVQAENSPTTIRVSANQAQ